MRKYRELPNWALSMDSYLQIDMARGYFENLKIEADTFGTYGWMISKERIDSVRAFLNEEPAVEFPVVYRGDVARSLSNVRNSGYSGFEFSLPYTAGADEDLGWIDVVGYQKDRPICQIGTLFHTNPDAIQPIPPPELMHRVVNNRDVQAFKVSGIKSFGDFLRPILHYRDLKSLHTMLDWGCGCGRMSLHFLSLDCDIRFSGCDIDSEAVNWCRRNLSSGEFSGINPYPPTAYPDRSFDLIIGFSVFTHLARDAQSAWLMEMRRIIRPGGLFLASVHGESVASDENPGQLRKLQRKGILDKIKDPTLEGIAPKGYYRCVYQTREYTVREWSNYFDIIAYIKRGVGNRQDLVIMEAS